MVEALLPDVVVFVLEGLNEQFVLEITGISLGEPPVPGVVGGPNGVDLGLIIGRGQGGQRLDNGVIPLRFHRGKDRAQVGVDLFALRL